MGHRGSGESAEEKKHRIKNDGERQLLGTVGCRRGVAHRAVVLNLGHTLRSSPGSFEK